MKKYYFDTCIWRDHYENRYSLVNNPLGNYATKLFLRIIKNKDIILFSELTVRELQINYNKEEIENMLKILHMLKILKRIIINKEDNKEAEKLSDKYKIPGPDALHAVLAKKQNAILVTQDKHFNVLKNIVNIKKPQEI